MSLFRRNPRGLVTLDTGQDIVIVPADEPELSYAPARSAQPSADKPEVAECPECFALVRPERLRAHEYWHDEAKGDTR